MNSEPFGEAAMNFICFPREERSDVAVHLSTGFRGSPQSASLLRDDKT